jgi:CheY-like chemotaxis protein
MSLINLLIIEDSKADILLLNRSLAKSSLKLKIKEVHDGEKAVHFLDGLTYFKKNDWPDLVLLDLNLPKIDGHQILKKIKTSEQLNSIPVIIYSSTDVDSKFIEENKIKPNGAARKPRSLKEASAFVDQIETFLKNKKII